MASIIAAGGCVAIILYGRFAERHNMNPFTLLVGLLVAGGTALVLFGG